MNKLSYLLAASCVGLTAGALVVQTGAKAAKPRAAAPAVQQPASSAGSAGGAGYSSGLTVTIDPETKQIRQATPEEAQALTASVPAPLPQAVRYANGMRMARLPESYMETATVRKNADGSLSFQCASEKDQVSSVPQDKLPTSATTTTARLEEK
jgi:hypothetical protein